MITRRKALALLVAFFCCAAFTISADITAINRLEFNKLLSINRIPSKDVQVVYQDKQGFIWFGTRFGLCQYDGYELKVYKSDYKNPELLSCNNIQCLAEDASNQLWIGTQDGLNVLDKTTGIIRKVNISNIYNNCISCILVTRDNIVWIGTDSGLCKYNPATDSFIVYSNTETHNVLTTTSIKSLLEDSYGDIWIGTWSKGLYRYTPKNKRFIAYPSFNEKNSAFYIYEDSRRTIWVGSWDCGLFHLENPRNMKSLHWESFTHQSNNTGSLADNIVYCINEDPLTKSLWVGTRSGLCICSLENPGFFTSYFPGSKTNPFPANEVNSILRDKNGTMLIGTIDKGVFQAKHNISRFGLLRMAVSNNIETNAIRKILIDNDNRMWLSVGSFGVYCVDRATGKSTNCLNLPEFKNIEHIPTVHSILEKPGEHEIWLATHNEGILIYKKGQPVRVLTTANCNFISDPYVTAMYSDSKKNTWIGTRFGLGVMQASGKGFLFKAINVDNVDLSKIYVRSIVEDRHHRIWVACNNHGVFRFSPSVSGNGNYNITHFAKENKKLSMNAMICIFEDSKGRIWAGGEGGGLYIHRKETDDFECVTLRYQLPSDVINSIQEDENGHLWLATNIGLICLELHAGSEPASYRIYTEADGLQENYFISNSAFRKGKELFFGGGNGLNYFLPGQIRETRMDAPIVITDIKIFNTSLSDMDPRDRKRITTKAPDYTDQITIPNRFNNFTIEFAALTYTNPELNRYAYKLVGFDRDWQYTTASRRFANYNNLNRGTYTFLIKASNKNGVWGQEIRKLRITVKPPFWASWFAYLIYVALLLFVFYELYKRANQRISQRNQLQLEEIERSKADEINQAKLNFFTNVTHELLTPLTTLSASVEELKMAAPQHENQYSVMTLNINRLIRLLQQILDFRKMESGSLRLRVIRGDISAFIQREADFFKPLIRKRRLHLSVVSEPESIVGYFDPDKLDKILYNLLSNASKYNHDDGFIHINLKYDELLGDIQIVVEDNGIGISTNDQKNLFTRFYKGENCPVNTPGTGIGLSLVKDLIRLHKGCIRVESQVNKGTRFILDLPINREAYTKEELAHPAEPVIPAASQTADLPVEDINNELTHNKDYTILIVEDEELLLSLMSKLLSHEYNILIARDGDEAFSIVKEKEVDLVVTDLMMPGMDGIELCRCIKSNFEYSHIAVVLLTARNTEEDRATAYDAGADGFLAKPFNLSVLHSKIRNLLQRKEQKAEVFKKQHAIEIKDLNYTTSDELFLQNAIDVVQRNIDDPDFDQLRFVEEMNCSKSTLYKKIKYLTNLNTSAFICNVRLKAACKIIEEKKSIMISELAYAVGFSTPKYFSYCFKKEFGMLPSEYIERYQPGTSIHDEQEKDEL